MSAVIIANTFKTLPPDTVDPDALCKAEQCMISMTIPSHRLFFDAQLISLIRLLTPPAPKRYLPFYNVL